MEAIIGTLSWDVFPWDFMVGFKLFRTPIIGWLMIVVLNMFIDIGPDIHYLQILPRVGLIDSGPIVLSNHFSEHPRHLRI